MIVPLRAIFFASLFGLTKTMNLVDIFPTPKADGEASMQEHNAWYALSEEQRQTMTDNLIRSSSAEKREADDMKFMHIRQRYLDFVLENSQQMELPLKPGMIYFCQLDTSKKGGSYLTDQVHYFVIIYDAEPILLQALGGVKGFTIKLVSNINDAIVGVLRLKHQQYEELFSFPDDGFDHLFEFDNASFRYITLPLYYPILADLSKLLSYIDLTI